jgi:hypothetical protein
MTLPARACEVVGRTYLDNVLVSATRVMKVHATSVSAKNCSAQTARAFDFEVCPLCGRGQCKRSGFSPKSAV